MRLNLQDTRVRWLLGWIIAGAVVSLLTAVLWWANWRGLAFASGGAFAIAAAFFFGLALVRLILTPAHPVTGIARTLIDEAIRMKVALIFIVALIVLIPLLPVLLDPQERLSYRMQFFLTWSLSIVSFLLSVMTIFLACATISRELEQKQIFLTMTKPVSRSQYLLGKWLGITLLNLVLLVVSGVAIFTFTRMLAGLPAWDVLDRIAVNEQILTARQTVGPTPPAEMNFGQMALDRLRQLHREDEQAYPIEGDLNSNAVVQQAFERLDDTARNNIINNLRTRWHTLEHLNTETYLFTNLQQAKALGRTVQLRFKPNATQEPPDAKVRLAMWVNGRPLFVAGSYAMSKPFANNMYHVEDIPTELIDPSGNLQIQIANVELENPPATFNTSITFTPGEGLELLYRVGHFEPNLVRCLLIMWVRLSFLAVLGLTCATFLGFPIACLLSFLVFFTATTSGFITESLSNYAAFTNVRLPLFDQIMAVPSTMGKHLSEGKFWDAMKIVIRLTGEGFNLLVPSFSKYEGVSKISDGRVITWELLRETIIWVGLVWSGVIGLCGLFAFSRRELARVMV